MQGTHSNDGCLLVGTEAFRKEDALGYGTTYVFLKAMVDWARKLQSFNVAMLAKQGWKILSDPDSI